LRHPYSPAVHKTSLRPSCCHYNTLAINGAWMKVWAFSKNGTKKKSIFIVNYKNKCFNFLLYDFFTSFNMLWVTSFLQLVCSKFLDLIMHAQSIVLWSLLIMALNHSLSRRHHDLKISWEKIHEKNTYITKFLEMLILIWFDLIL
jgi:hypothetical protein